MSPEEKLEMGRTLEEIEALAAAATPGPWEFETGDGAPIGNVQTADGHLIFQAQQNATVKGSDYSSQTRMRNANAAFSAEIWVLLSIAQEQRGAMSADEERMRAAAMRVWGDHVRGCDTADAMADLIVRQRAEVERLRADRVKFFHIAEVLSSCPMSCRKAEVYARHVQNAQELTGRAG